MYLSIKIFSWLVFIRHFWDINIKYMKYHCICKMNIDHMYIMKNDYIVWTILLNFIYNIYHVYIALSVYRKFSFDMKQFSFFL